MTYLIWIILLTIIISSITTYLIIKPKIKQTEQFNESVRQKNLILDKEQIALNSSIAELKKHHDDVQKNIELNIQTLQKEKNIRLKNFYDNSKQEYLNEYLSTIKDLESDLHQHIIDYNDQMTSMSNSLIDFQSKVQATVEYDKRHQEEVEQQDFYKLQLSSIDIEEIKKLKEVGSLLRDPLPLNKVIYQMYYKNPLTDLLGRVVGKNIVTGIYKITNINNHMCYIGQAVDIATRWQTHVKKGVGAEPSTANKLYPAMLKEGVENFTFEIIEICPRDKLNEREQYWQEIFKAKEFGYSIR